VNWDLSSSVTDIESALYLLKNPSARHRRRHQSCLITFKIYWLPTPSVSSVDSAKWLLMDAGSRRRGGSSICQRGTMASAWSASLKRGSGAESPAGSRGRAPVGKTPWSWKLFVYFHTKRAKSLVAKFSISRKPLCLVHGGGRGRPPGPPIPGSASEPTVVPSNTSASVVLLATSIAVVPVLLPVAITAVSGPAAAALILINLTFHLNSAINVVYCA